jgi:hypothetical protein
VKVAAPAACLLVSSLAACGSAGSDQKTADAVAAGKPLRPRGPGVPKHDWVTNREEVFMRLLEASYTGAREGRIFGRIPVRRVLLDGRSKGLVRGLTGMKVGGRRELIVPPKLAYPRWKPSWGYAPYVSIYVIDLVGMEPPLDPRVEYRNRPFGKGYPRSLVRVLPLCLQVRATVFRPLLQELRTSFEK